MTGPTPLSAASPGLITVVVSVRWSVSSSIAAASARWRRAKSFKADHDADDGAYRAVAWIRLVFGAPKRDRPRDGRVRGRQGHCPDRPGGSG